jgi:hypothetical protein
VVELAGSYVADAAPDKKWVEVSDAGEAAFRNQHAKYEAMRQACSVGSDGRRSLEVMNVRC